ncbi:phage terminase large subunit [Dysgonomonas sp. PFB1-18]|uniref:PBSX family phage terminase large subunit n=1 Tax=unclassified Dysgonomonas TaxID=2630389 RepID=UPI002473AEF2|nr:MULTISPECIES: terminase large subunit [unclassified Dysgonomonas]MDL2302865.1 terminase large subunit [Dysgonomonas sp. OttesenSCG-928-D17]MDH6309610.1 phage terminase large subunit [Dysgonomonas sp. PF1-14]MDH6339062.1 phage terminase large subunit [Dysgonomonas sp. PF1-16]MDH6380652.1 phage terminase large subunit [Dysgonomonas sp. PFB1-18]MDH6398148.1 phage terminase large subunit [Dysgonomonas sp. PF1-23]
MNITSVFSRNMDAYNNGVRYIVNKGSTRSSKTYSVLQLLFTLADKASSPKTISIVSESLPHLKKGCIRDFKEILQQMNSWDEKNWNATDKIYMIKGSMIEFFSADNPSKVHGPSRNILYINECINIDYEIYRQLAIRTTETIFLDCNPCFEFWLDERVLTQPEVELIHSTYKDNQYLSSAQIKEIESNRNDAEWWQVYGEGLTGTRQGGVMRNWDIVEKMPDTYKKRWLGMDFGFTNDPTAIVDIRLSDGELWIDELLYEKGYDNMMIASVLEELDIPRDTPVVADSAEPKSIREIASKGWKVEPAEKGKDSITTGISILNRYKKHITKGSTNIINEYRNYRWKTDEFGNATNTPIDRYNHSIDAQRYVCLNKLMENNGELNYSVIKGK